MFHEAARWFGFRGRKEEIGGRYRQLEWMVVKVSSPGSPDTSERDRKRPNSTVLTLPTHSADPNSQGGVALGGHPQPKEQNGGS